jgi:hypothetical protein
MAGNIERSIRLRPNVDEFLDVNSFDNGEIYYDSKEKTLRIFDGDTPGGFPLLRADLANISGGGGGGAGTVNFGSKTIQAQAFIGDGSQITNLPIPTDAASLTDVQNAFNTPATTSTLGTIKVGNGLLITPDGVLSAAAFEAVTGFNNLQFLSFTTGVSINEFSSDPTLGSGANDAVPTEGAVKTYVDTKVSQIDFSSIGEVGSGVAGALAYYAADGKIVSDTAETGGSLLWNSTTFSLSSPNLSTTNLVVTNIDGGQASFNDVVSTNIKSNNIFNDDLGTFRLSVGSDFIIDSPGVINVLGSRIVNLGTPTEDSHAVNKAYVDGAASAFSGGDVPNPINILSTLASSSPTTGALKVAGGVGVQGSIYSAGPIFVAGSPVLTSLSGGYNGGTISGTLFINNSTISTSPTTGAFRVTGGAGIGRNLYTGGDSFFNGIRFGNGAEIGSGFSQNLAAGGGTGINSPLNSNLSGVNNIALGFSTLGQIPDGSDNIAIGNQVMANKLSGSFNIGIGTDVLINNQGAGNLCVGYLAGSLMDLGNNNVIIGGNNGFGIYGLDSHIILSTGDGAIRLQINNNGAFGLGGASYGDSGQVLTSVGDTGLPIWTNPAGFTGGTVEGQAIFANTTESTATNNGAVTIAGGLGISKNLNVGGIIDATSIQNTPIGSSTRSSGAFTTLAANGVTSITNATGSSATNNGALVVTGGVGVGGALNVGSTFSSGGVASFTANTASTASNNGSVVVTGGLGVSGAIYAGSIQNTPIGSTTTNTGAFTSLASTSLTVTGTTIIQQSSELFQTINAATGTVVHNWNNGAIFYHTNPSNDFTANFTNVPTTNNYSHSVALVVIQGATPRRPTGVAINGAVQTINWANNTVPAGVANRTQIFSFSLLRVAGTWRVIGAAQGY